MAVQERDLNADDDFADDDEVVYYHSNTLYSVYALTDDGENVVERYRYDAYGAATVLDSDFSSDADGASDVENPYSFTGRRLDAESGLMQYRNRYYDAGQGRFVGRDPVLSQNLYQMVGGRPGTAIDPYGLNGTNIWNWQGRGEYIGPRSTGNPATSPDTPEQYRQETPQERKERLKKLRKREEERRRREREKELNKKWGRCTKWSKPYWQPAYPTLESCVDDLTEDIAMPDWYYGAGALACGIAGATVGGFWGGCAGAAVCINIWAGVAVGVAAIGREAADRTIASRHAKAICGGRACHKSKSVAFDSHGEPCCPDGGDLYDRSKLVHPNP